MNYSFSNLEIVVEQRRDRNVFEIWVVDHRPDSDDVISLGEEGLWIKTNIPNGEMKQDLKPFLTLPMYFSFYFFKAIAEHFEKRGIKTQDANLIEGKLLATEKHLADMQEFAKKLLDASLK